MVKSEKEKKPASILDMVKLKSENDKLRQLLCSLLLLCQVCDRRLMLLNWNKVSYILACDNGNCRNYRTPIKNIDKAQIESIVGVRKKHENSYHQ